MARRLQVGHAGSSWAFTLRLGLAIVGSLYAALLAAAMVRAAVLGGGVELAFSFFATGVLVLILVPRW